jgi:hypothetical protein
MGKENNYITRSFIIIAFHLELIKLLLEELEMDDTYSMHAGSKKFIQNLWESGA